MVQGGLMSIRVLVASLPRLLADMLAGGIDDALDMTLSTPHPVGARPGTTELDRIISDAQPDAAIVGIDDVGEVGLTRLRLRHRDLVIVALSVDGTTAWSVELRPHLRRLDAVSPQAIRDLLRREVKSLRSPDALPAPGDATAAESTTDESTDPEHPEPPPSAAGPDSAT
jgi:hypothetical protein